MTNQISSFASLPWWFTEGSAEFVHGADDRVKNDFTTAADIVAAMPTGPAGGSGTSLGYSSSYLAMRFLHQSAGDAGIKGLMTWLKKGETFDDALAKNTGFANTAAFEAAYKGADGIAYVQGLKDGGYFDNDDTGAIGGSDASRGAVLTAESVMPDTGGYTYNPLRMFEEIWPDGFDRVVSYNSFDLQVGEKSGESLKFSIGATTASALGLLNASVSQDPNTVIDKIDLALNYLNEQRGILGATINRIDHIINVNAINVESTSDARSRILDADLAKETGELSRIQILTQAGQAMLSQANTNPQQVLKLING